MWRAGEVTKPVYICLCNQIHLLDLQVKGGEDSNETKKAKQDLMAELVGSKTKTTIQAQGKPKQRKQPRQSADVFSENSM